MRRLTTTVLAFALLASACSSDAPSTGEPNSPNATPATDAPTPDTTSTPEPTPSRSTPAADEATDTPAVALSDEELVGMRVNELGRVLVAEWHEIQDTTADYKTALPVFRAQLQDLYDRGYRPISVDEFVSGTFPIPAGTSPVLLTFDDSYKEHLFFGDDGAPHPDSVVGILEAMEATDPTWRARAVFAFYWPVPFRESGDDLIAAKFTYLVEHGFDLSNHSEYHEDLSSLSNDEAAADIARSQARLEALVPGAPVTTITLPFGQYPEDRQVVMGGEVDGTNYQHDLAFMVGWMPTRSPHHVEFDPTSVMRVPAHGPWRGEDPTWDDWLDWLDEPDRRFVSDGDPDVVTYPADFAEVAGDIDAEVRTYERPDAG